mgnify:CR=1 FL=1
MGREFYRERQWAKSFMILHQNLLKTDYFIAMNDKKNKCKNKT